MTVTIHDLIFMTSLLNQMNRFKKNKRGEQDVDPTKDSIVSNLS